MSELYLRSFSATGEVRLRLEHDGAPAATLITDLPRLHFLTAVGALPNTSISVIGIRVQDPLLCVLEKRTPTPMSSDRSLDRKGYTTVSNNQITIRIDTTGSELLVGWFEEP